MKQITIRRCLTQRKPRISPFNRPLNRPKKNLSEDLTIEEWRTFEQEFKSNGALLDIPNPFGDREAPKPPDFFGENGINPKTDLRVWIEWNVEVLTPCLESLQREQGLFSGIEITHQYSRPGKAYRPEIINESGKKATTEHVVYLDTAPKEYLVVGRVQRDWSGRDLMTGWKLFPELMNPVAKLRSRCRVANTRYGYIQTYDELVVCSFDPDGRNVEVKAIPLSMHSPERLTADLALFGLHDIALNKPAILRGFEKPQQVSNPLPQQVPGTLPPQVLDFTQPQQSANPGNATQLGTTLETGNWINYNDIPLDYGGSYLNNFSHVSFDLDGINTNDHQVFGD